MDLNVSYDGYSDVMLVRMKIQIIFNSVSLLLLCYGTFPEETIKKTFGQVKGESGWFQSVRAMSHQQMGVECCHQPDM